MSERFAAGKWDRLKAVLRNIGHCAVTSAVPCALLFASGCQQTHPEPIAANDRAERHNLYNENLKKTPGQARKAPSVDNPPSLTTPTGPLPWFVQVFATVDATKLQGLEKDLTSAGNSSQVVQRGRLHSLQVGPFNTKEDAKRWTANHRIRHPDAFVLQDNRLQVVLRTNAPEPKLAEIFVPTEPELAVKTAKQQYQGWFVQLMAVADKALVNAPRQQLHKVTDIETRVVQNGRLHLFQAGPFATKQAASAWLELHRQQQPDAFITEGFYTKSCKDQRLNRGSLRMNIARIVDLCGYRMGAWRPGTATQMYDWIVRYDYKLTASSIDDFLAHLSQVYKIDGRIRTMDQSIDFYERGEG